MPPVLTPLLQERSQTDAAVSSDYQAIDYQASARQLARDYLQSAGPGQRPELITSMVAAAFNALYEAQAVADTAAGCGPDGAVERKLTAGISLYAMAHEMRPEARDWLNRVDQIASLSR